MESPAKLRGERAFLHMLFFFLKWIHILAAIVALGANITYGIWLARSSRAPEHLLFTLHTIKFLDDRMANPAYVVSLLTGLAMIYVSGYTFTTPWLMLSLALYALLVILGIFGYSPTLAQQIQLAETTGPETAEYQAMARRGRMLGMVLGIITVGIVFLMVVKPPLWG